MAELKVLITRDQIAQRVAEMGAAILPGITPVNP